MKTEIEIAEADVSRILRFNTSPAPSLRVPVTIANRALLRWLRNEELSAWKSGRICSCGRLAAVAPMQSEDNPV